MEDIRIQIAVKILPEIDRAIEKIAFEQEKKKREVIEEALKVYVDNFDGNGHSDTPGQGLGE